MPWAQVRYLGVKFDLTGVLSFKAQGPSGHECNVNDDFLSVATLTENDGLAVQSWTGYLTILLLFSISIVDVIHLASLLLYLVLVCKFFDSSNKRKGGW